MSRSTGLMVVAVFSVLAMVLLANSPSAEASGNCEGKLFGNSYDCSFKDNHTGSLSDCFEFGNLGISEFFDLLSNSASWGCACNPTGSVNSPSFDSSSEHV